MAKRESGGRLGTRAVESRAKRRRDSAMSKDFGELVLVLGAPPRASLRTPRRGAHPPGLGDAHIPHRAGFIPDKFQRMLVGRPASRPPLPIGGVAWLLPLPCFGGFSLCCRCFQPCVYCCRLCAVCHRYLLNPPHLL